MRNENLNRWCIAFFNPKSAIRNLKYLLSLLLERPVGIQKIIDERGRNNARGLMKLRHPAWIEDTQEQEGRIADCQRGKGNDVELQAPDVDIVAHVPFREGPEIIEEKIRDDRYFDGDRRRYVLVQPQFHEQRERAEVH